jgi:hypothetical protein
MQYIILFIAQFVIVTFSVSVFPSQFFETGNSCELFFGDNTKNIL